MGIAVGSMYAFLTEGNTGTEYLVLGWAMLTTVIFLFWLGRRL
jgi:hypothetical protein